MFALIQPCPGARAALAGALVALAACAPGARAAQGDDGGAEIVVQALALLGVPYRWGGSDPARGLDCSGLVRHVFRSVAALELPRRSEQIGRLGRSVARAELRAGDLVFFNTLGYRNSHVAVYVGDGRFVHAPGRKGQVRIVGLDERYWRERFNGARRIELAPAANGPQLAIAPLPPARPSWRDVDDDHGP
jgi:cell wall-associated NlpC family hydrolase